MMNVDVVIERARERAGVDTFHSESFREGLDIVAEAVTADPKSPERERRITNECTRALVSRLRVDDWLRSYPDVAESAVSSPVFVIGMPRTGTTILVNLIGQDRESCRVIWNWEIDQPTPPADPMHLLDDPRIAVKVAKLAPVREKLSHLPRMELATDPVECVHVLAQDFKSLFWQLSTGSARYDDWFLDEADLRSAYLHHRRTLQVLQSGGAKGQWVLKLPSHALHLEALLSVYPDARLVITHRDPLQSLVSMCSYAKMMHEVNGNQITHEEVISTTWRHVLDSAIRTVDFVTVHPEVPTYNVYQGELAADPIEQVNLLRAWIGLEPNDDLDARIRHYLNTDWPHPPGSHRYTASDFAVTRAAVDEAFAPYTTAFDVPSEDE